MRATWLEDVVLAQYGLILNREFQLIPGVNAQFDFWWNLNSPWCSVDETDHRNLSRIPHRPVRELDVGTCIYGLSFFDSYVYGHLWDAMQPLQAVEDLKIDGVLLHPIRSQVRFLGLHLDIFGYPTKKRMALDALTQNYRVPKLVVPFLQCNPNHIDPDAKDWLANKYLNYAKLDGAPRKLYLSRVAANERFIKNEDKVVKLLRDHGFTIVTGGESLQDHINWFHSAEVIIGYHGSLFKNILFCKNRPKVLEFRSKERPDSCFQIMNETCSITDEYRVILINSDSFPYYNADIDLELLSDILKLGN